MDYPPKKWFKNLEISLLNLNSILTQHFELQISQLLKKIKSSIFLLNAPYLKE
jgi:hypothetical protein